MFKVQEFKSDLLKRGTVRNNSFLVEFGVPPYLEDRYNSTKEISIRCENTNLPGLSFATLDGPPRYGYGPIESLPYNIVYDQIPLTFIVDRESEIHKFFYDWTNCIVNFSRNRETLNETKQNNRSIFRTYEVGYKNKYAVPVTIHVFNEQGGKIMEAKLSKAWPKSITPIDLGWDQYDTLMKLQINLSFREYTYQYIKSELIDSPITTNTNTLNQI